MSFWARLKFFFGIVFVCILVGLLVLYLNSAMSVVRANRAELGADTTSLGLDYPGVIVTQNVTVGDKVTKNEVLYTVNSPQLSDAISNKTVQIRTLPFSLEPKTQFIQLKANNDGVVEKVNYVAGSYVPGGSVLATIDSADTLYISGHFHLSPPDYARVKKGNSMDVTFPDNSKVQAKVYSISLVQDGDVVDTVVKAKLLGSTVGDFRFPVGTPVEASLKLTQRTWWQDVTHFVNRLFKPSAE
jgi:multidrug resistance efflux pump